MWRMAPDVPAITAATGSGDLILSIISMERAHEESRIKQVRGLAVWKNKRSDARLRPMTAMAPKWLRLDKDHGRFEVLEERAAVIRDIFESSAAGLGIYAITERLNRTGVRPFGGSRGPGHGWHCSYVCKLLSNRAVLDNVANIFSGGILRCAYCGAGMVRENKGRKNGSSFLCGGVRRGLKCIRTRWSYTDFEKSFLSFCSELDLPSIVGDDRGRRAETERRIVALQGELATLRDLRDQTFELLKKKVEVEYVARRLEEIEKQRAALEVELREQEVVRAELDGAVAGLEDIRPLIEQIQGGSGDTYALRSQVAQKIRSLVMVVHVAPCGHTPLVRRTIEFLKGQPGNTLDVTGHLERRLESEEESRPYFAVGFKNGTTRAVFPNKDDPTRVHVQATSSPDEGLVLRYPDHDAQVFLPRFVASDLEPGEQE